MYKRQVEHAARIAAYELASAVDNPVVTLDGRVESNGNFHLSLIHI